MAELKLGGRRGGIAIVDDECLPWLSRSGWHLDQLGYVRGRFDGKTQHIHRVITGAAAGIVVDHINGNKLDNRRENLRLCTQRQNACNTPMKRNNTSGVTGVSWDKSRGKWLAHIKVNRKFVNLGWHVQLSDAAKARLDAELVYFGDFAHKRTTDCC